MRRQATHSSLLQAHHCVPIELLCLWVCAALAGSPFCGPTASSRPGRFRQTSPTLPHPHTHSQHRTRTRTRPPVGIERTACMVVVVVVVVAMLPSSLAVYFLAWTSSTTSCTHPSRGASRTTPLSSWWGRTSQQARRYSTTTDQRCGVAWRGVAWRRGMRVLGTVAHLCRVCTHALRYSPVPILVHPALCRATRSC